MDACMSVRLASGGLKGFELACYDIGPKLSLIASGSKQRLMTNALNENFPLHMSNGFLMSFLATFWLCSCNRREKGRPMPHRGDVTLPRRLIYPEDTTQV